MVGTQAIMQPQNLKHKWEVLRGGGRGIYLDVTKQGGSEHRVRAAPGGEEKTQVISKNTLWGAEQQANRQCEFAGTVFIGFRKS